MGQHRTMPLPAPHDWLAAATALIAPPLCVSCRRPPPSPGDPLCTVCRAALPWLRGPRCPRCALPSPCGARCPMAGGAIAHAWAPVAFEGPARAVVHALKFQGALGLAELMAAQMVATAPAGLLEAGAGLALVPVPTPDARRRRRGFDHAARLADAVGARTGLPVARCLRRTGAAPRQARARRAARLAQGRVQLAIRGTAPRRVVLVDDVHTTGATLQACARKLIDNGAFQVSALAYARALR
jgi:predicted amidophosphoribosyltransferase